MIQRSPELDDPGRKLGAASERPRVLAVDDDPSIVEAETATLREEGYLVEPAFSAEEALRKVRRIPFDVAITDLEMPAMKDLDLLKDLGEIDPELPVLICASQGDHAGAQEAIRQGAYDYLSKPLKIRDLILRVSKALERRRLSDLVELLRRQLGQREGMGALLGGSIPMQSVYHKIEHVARRNATVLILGEPGTGKELVAWEIHRLSPRRSGPFITAGCEDLSRSLAEAEPAGSRESPDTPSPDPVTLTMQEAQSGTLLLHEIGSLSPAAQAHLMSILQQQEAWRGERASERELDGRVIATSAIDLDRAMEEGTFLPDLYHYLSEFVLVLPPLRERMEDVQTLSAHFLEKACGSAGRPVKRLSPRSLELMTTYRWPGNVREMQKVIDEAVISSRHQVIRPRDLSRCETGRLGHDRPQTLAEIERRHIQEVLKQTSGNKMHAAKLLGIRRSTLYRKLQRM